MNQDRMKTLFLRDKEFLRSLYSSESPAKSKNILTFASDAHLNTLIKFLHLVSNGQIQMKKEHFDTLGTRHIKIFRKELESKAALKRLLTASRKDKLQLLVKLSAQLPNLLFTLFNQILT